MNLFLTRGVERGEKKANLRLPLRVEYAKEPKKKKKGTPGAFNSSAIRMRTKEKKGKGKEGF